MPYVEPINIFSEITTPTIVNIMVDNRYSMIPWHSRGIVRRVLNEIVYPGLNELNTLQKISMRVALHSFSYGSIRHMTDHPGYFKPEYFLNKPIKDSQFCRHDGIRSANLFGSVVDGIKDSLEAARIVRNLVNCPQVDVKMIVMTCGFKGHDDILTSPEDVNKAMIDADPFINLDVFLTYFKSTSGPDWKDFLKLAVICGVAKSNCFFIGHDPSDIDSHLKSFRDLMRVHGKPL